MIILNYGIIIIIIIHKMNEISEWIQPWFGQNVLFQWLIAENSQLRFFFWLFLVPSLFWNIFFIVDVQFFLRFISMVILANPPWESTHTNDVFLDDCYLVEIIFKHLDLFSQLHTHTHQIALVCMGFFVRNI